MSQNADIVFFIFIFSMYLACTVLIIIIYYYPYIRRTPYNNNNNTVIIMIKSLYKNSKNTYICKVCHLIRCVFITLPYIINSYVIYTIDNNNIFVIIHDHHSII